MNYYLRLVTPDVAAKLLENKAPNRNLSSAIVKKYASAMLANEWYEAGDPVRINIYGQLMDGQHRLAAIIESGCSIELLIVEGVQPDAMMVLDTGRKRSLRDVLAIKGEERPSELATAINADIIYTATGETRRGVSSLDVRLDHISGLRHLSQHPGLRLGAAQGQRIRMALRGPGGMYSSLMYRFGCLDAADVEDFVDKLVEGAGLESTDPIFKLREALLRERHSQHVTEQRVLGAWVIKMWNAYRDGEEVQHLSFRAGGRAPEQYPVPH